MTQTQLILQLPKLSNEKLLAQRTELSEIIKEAQESLDTINGLFMERIKEKGDDLYIPRQGKVEAIVTIVKRHSYKNVLLSTAKRYGAIKEVIDSAKLLPYVKAGRKIAGVETTEYITVK